MNQVGKIPNSYFLLFSWIVAIIATGGSLFFSEVMHWTPCTLCWYQRILMYPLVIILGLAYLRNDRFIRIYVLSISVPGFVLACYHYALQMLPPFSAIAVCSPDNSCSEKTFAIFGFITIPFLSGTAFLLITLGMLMIHKNSD
ncbi:disulfide oxidoreductase [Sporolactobacillus sp. CPB3-1]|uniref:Disulfide oxidoreductase n=1 Tax=Sporolactobacillus mangiferae TaxID=2940498 RepID=A0ABT0M9I1_9BACL|nr:disulfide oxidoreductase [Sporolactobacillus mangiferae]MCL1631524.1 disulfide oxidoreductase [Sporolactobacillus mangiferae]